MKTHVLFALLLLCSPWAHASAVEEPLTPEIRKEMGEAFKITPQWFIYDRLVRSEKGEVKDAVETRAIRYNVSFPAMFREGALSTIMLEVGDRPNLVSCELFRRGDGKEPRTAFFTIDPAQVATSRIVVGYVPEGKDTELLVSILLKNFLANKDTPVMNITGRK